MQYTFTGQLCGFICPEIEEPLANMTVRFYRPDQERRGTVERATARPKETFAILEEGDVEAKEDRLLAETETDDEGEFGIELGEAEEYDGEAFEIDVRTDHVPGEQHDDVDSLQFTLTTHQPRWRETEDGIVSRWEYCVPNRFWCAVRERFGAWVICGTVTDCETEEPRSGLEVIAYDKDIIQPDQLGSATTDANGHFRIYYKRSDFERVPLSLSPVELVGGPDVYFEVRDGSGTQLLVEDPSRGRESGRENIGTCFHEDLCVDLPPPPEDGDGAAPVPMFTHVGTYDIRTQIDANGYAQSGGDDLAFTGTLPLRGVLPPGGSGSPKEYRFRIENRSTGNVRNVDASMIAPTQIGILQYYDASGSVTRLRQDPYYVNNSGAANNVSVGSKGWIRVPTENDLGGISRTGSGKFVRNTGNLIRLNTRRVIEESFDLTSPSVHVAGDSLDPGEKSDTHTYRLVFETRDVGGGSVRRDELAKIVFSNSQYTQIRHPSWSGGPATTRGVVMLDIEEFRNANDGCIRLSDTLNALVTAYHDHINAAKLRLEGASWSQTLSLTDDEFSGSVSVPISSLDPCAYVLWLDVSYDLTDGSGRVDAQHDHIAFCVSEGS